MNFTKPTLVTITAPTCSGKSYLIERLAVQGFNRIVGFTTRDPRPGEIDGYDYYFLTLEEVERLEREDLLAETVTFRGNRYGVTHAEMEKRVNGNMPPVIILEPQGLASYEKYCKTKGWDIFKIFVSTTEQTRIKRLNERTAADVLEAATSGNIFNKLSLARIMSTHSDRLLSITGDERLWITVNTWDAVVPGDDIGKALSFIEEGIKWRNSLKATL
ncbi:hypothetical protein [Acinetobacter sp.]|uniref:hypothetical protein n=1 Tax=Acinetobacter sp. TaxID=472 RepID=UPI003890C8B1